MKELSIMCKGNVFLMPASLETKARIQVNHITLINHLMPSFIYRLYFLPQTPSVSFEFFAPNLNLGEGSGTPLQYSCLGNSMDRGAWWAAVHGVAKSHTRLKKFTFTFYFHALEKEMATHSSVLAWRIPGTGEPGGLPSMGSHRVGHD